MMASRAPNVDINQLIAQNISAFTVESTFEAIHTSWSLDRHHLVYAKQGLFTLEVEDAVWRLPPSRAAWIPASAEVCVRSERSIDCISVLFRRDFVVPELFQCRVFQVSPLIREMILFSRRWQGETETPQDAPAIDHFYATLAFLCRESFQNLSTLYLPKAQSPEMSRLLNHILATLDHPLTLEDLAEFSGFSKRTLSRRFSDELHITWSQYLHRARMIRALDLLATGQNVTETALSVGFQSMSAFSTAFRSFADLSPKQYQNQFALPQ